jgi:hypothetical protein
LLSLRTKFPQSRRIRGRIPQSCRRRRTERNRCATPGARSPKRGEVIDLVCFHGKSDTEVAKIVGIAEEFVARRPLLTTLPRRAVNGGAAGAGLIVVSFFFLGLVLFHSLIGLLPHFFEVIGFRLTRFPR